MIVLEIESGVATLGLDRPAKRNAIDDEMRARLVAALDGIAADKDIRALVLTGKGEGFCAGGDIAAMEKRLQAPSREDSLARQHMVHEAQARLHALPVPTIAAVNGAAAGLGADMAIACDFVMASRRATFAWSYIRRGLVPDGGGSYFLPRRVGLARARDLIFTGRTIDAEEALRIGVADRVTSPEALLADAKAWALELGHHSRTALALAKSILDRGLERPMREVFDEESRAQVTCYASAEHRDAVTAFLAKRAAKKGP